MLGKGDSPNWVARLEPAGFESGGRPRVMMYCASNIGLGHLHRLTRIAAELRRQLGEVDILLVTDTQSLSAEEIDPEIGLVRLPEFEFREGSFKNRASGLGLEKQQLRNLRANLILAAATGFQPHVLLMDTNPHGKRNELEPLLKQLARMKSPPLRLLQLRDIPFPPEESSRLTTDAGRVTADFKLYDHVLVAGDPGFFDLAENYGWPADVASRIEYLGFVVSSPDRAGGDSPEGGEVAKASAVSARGSASRAKPVPVERWEAEGGAVDPEESEAPSVAVKPSNGRRRHIVAAMGGGWELESFGHPVVDAYLHLFPDGGHGVRFTLMTGPAVANEGIAELAALVKGRPDIRIVRYSRNFERELRECDLAILQAGSTPFQILDTDIPMLLYSRDYSTAEQECRAQRLAAFAGVERLGADDMEPSRLARRMGAALEQPRVKRETKFGFKGAERAAGFIVEQLRQG